MFFQGLKHTLHQVEADIFTEDELAVHTVLPEVPGQNQRSRQHTRNSPIAEIMRPPFARQEPVGQGTRTVKRPGRAFVSTTRPTARPHNSSCHGRHSAPHTSNSET